MTELVESFKLEPDYKVEADLACSCCLTSAPSLTNMHEIFDNGGTMESYCVLINRCYNTQMIDSSRSLSTNNICNTCVQRLIDAFLFKSQVLKSQRMIILGHTEYPQTTEIELGRDVLKIKTFDGDSDSDNNSGALVDDMDNSLDEDSLDHKPLKELDKFSARSTPSTTKRKRPAAGGKKTALAKMKALALEKSQNVKANTRKRSAKAKIAKTEEGVNDTDADESAADKKPTPAKKSPRKRKKATTDDDAPKTISARKTVKQQRAEIKAAMDMENKQCRICKQTFRNHHTLHLHMNEHFANYTCEECGKGFATQHRLQSHRVRHKMGSFKCPDCDEVFDNFGKRIMHRSKHKRNNNVCPHCQARFTTFYSRQKHLRDVHGISTGHPCKICNVICLTSSCITGHMQRYHPIKTYSCHLCGKAFKETARLKLHMIVHNREKNVECSICSKAYARKKTLREHMKIHMNIRSYPCPHCGLTFVQNCSLKAHLQKHEKEIILEENYKLL